MNSSDLKEIVEEYNAKKGSLSLDSEAMKKIKKFLSKYSGINEFNQNQMQELFSIIIEYFTKKHKTEITKAYLEQIIEKFNPYDLGWFKNFIEIQNNKIQFTSLVELIESTFSNKYTNERIILNNFLRKLKSFTLYDDAGNSYYSSIIKLFNHKLGIYVLGDADGSFGRMVLLALVSQHMIVPQNYLDDLLYILRKEFEVCKAGDGYVSVFQKDRECAFFIQEVIKNSKFQKQEQQLIFIGDILHDRFSCHKTATALLVEKLHEVGAIFIRGNHDLIEAYNELNVPQGGQSAVIGLDYTNLQAIRVESIFVNSYLDKKNKCFYIHNGIRCHNRTIETAFGVFNVSSIEELHRQINIQRFNDREIRAKFTDFRPSDERLVNSNFPILNGYKIIHGHNANCGIFIKKNSITVANINSFRDNMIGRMPCAIGIDKNGNIVSDLSYT